MGDSKRRKAMMGDNYGKPQQRWEVYELLIKLIEDNYSDLVNINSEGFAKSGKGVVLALYPENPTEAGLDGQLSYLPATPFIDYLRGETWIVKKYPHIIPGSEKLIKAYDPSKYMVLALFGAIKPFVMLLRTDSNPTDLIAQIQETVSQEIAESN